MIPGGRVDPRQMKRMMKQMGIETEEIEGVEEVVIKTADKEYVFSDAQVTKMVVKGQATFQILGEPEERVRSSSGPTKPSISTEDIKLVAEKAGVSEEEARKALEECDGEPAEAIIRLMSK